MLKSGHAETATPRPVQPVVEKVADGLGGLDRAASPQLAGWAHTAQVADHLSRAGTSNLPRAAPIPCTVDNVAVGRTFGKT